MAVSLYVDGARIEADDIEGDRYRFGLRLPVREIRVRSGAAQPAAVKSSADRRRLGVLLLGIQWSQGETSTDVPLGGPEFLDGFYRPETFDGGPARWTTGDAGLPLNAVRCWTGPAVLRLRLRTWEGSMQPDRVDDAAHVMGAFESLGETCEFGLVQRHFGVEPALTLFRWAGTSLEQVITGLSSGFAELGEAGSTEVVWSGSEYYLRTPFLYLHTNERVERDAAGIGEIAAYGRASLRMLRRKLIWDIAQARRIFLFASNKPGFTQAKMHRLHAALRTIGPAALLCVRQAGADETPGYVETLAGGLYAGCLGAIARPDKPFDQWMQVCSATLVKHQTECSA